MDLRDKNKIFLSASQKLELIRLKEKTRTTAEELARKFNIDTTTVHRIIRNKERLQEGLNKACQSGIHAPNKFPMSSPIAVVEDSLCIWIKQKQSENIKLTSNMIKAKAKELHKARSEAGTALPSYAFSDVWFDRFKKRYGLDKVKCQLEEKTTLADVEMVLLKSEELSDAEDEFAIDDTHEVYTKSRQCPEIVLYLCDFCRIARQQENIKKVEDKSLMIHLKVLKTFKMTLPKHLKLICDDCLMNLNDSYNFFKLVQEATIPFKVKTEQVEIVGEELSTADLDSWLHNDDDCVIVERVGENSKLQPTGSDVNIKFVVMGQKEQSRIQPPSTLLQCDLCGKDTDGKRNLRAHMKTHMERGHGCQMCRKKFQTRKKLLNHQKNGHCGEQSIISNFCMRNVYKKELEEGIFVVPPMEMELPEEDKLENGKISLSAREKIADKTWSDFFWNCRYGGCSKIFNDPMELKRHHKTHRRKKERCRLSCLECSKDNMAVDAFLNHAISHYPSLVFCCIFCSDYRHNLVDLFKHYEEEHVLTGVNLCLFCGKYYQLGGNLKEHVTFCHKQVVKELECDICGHKTNRRNAMKHHIDKHREAVIGCELCPKKYSTHFRLKQHVIESHGNGWVCAECGWFTRTKSLLQKHMKRKHTVHPEPSNEICHICGKTLRGKKNLKQHMRMVHDKSRRKINCPHCERKFKGTTGCNYHIRKAHTGEKPFQCCIPGCMLRSYDYSNCLKHIRIAHGIEGRPLKVSNLR